jgi:hypothetical protein
MIAAGYRDSSNPSNIASIMFERAPYSGGASSAGSIVFGAMANGTTGIPTERMRITEGGNIGIGTSSPNVYGAGFVNLQINSTTGGIIQATYGGTTAIAEILTTSGEGRFGTRTNHPMILKTNNTERMRLDSSGNVGIGTSSPQEKVHAYEASGFNDPSAYQFLAQNFSGFSISAGYGFAVTAGGETFAPKAAITLERTTAQGVGTFRISVDEVADVNSVESGDAVYEFIGASGVHRWLKGGTERMRLDSSGNLGIGTTAPESFGGGHKTLEVSGSSNAHGGVFKTATSDSAGAGSAGTEMLMYTTSSGGAIAVTSADPLFFHTSNTERMRIDSAGRVGIGATGNYTLTVGPQGGSGHSIIQLVNATTGTTAANGAYISVLGSQSDMRVWQQGNANILVGTNGAERMRISANGNIGIGGTPAEKFDVIAPDNSSIIMARVTRSSKDYGIALENNGGTGHSTINAFGSGAALIFETNGTERARITSGGTLAVGTTAGLNSELIHARRSSGTISTLYNSGATGDVLRLYHENTAVTAFSIWGGGAQRGFITSPASSNGLILGYSGTEAARIDFNGNIGIGVTPGCRLHVYAADTSTMTLLRGDTHGTRFGFSASESLIDSVTAAVSDYAPLQINAKTSLTLRLNSATVVALATSGMTVTGTAVATQGMPIITELTTARTLALSDIGAYIKTGNAAATTITVPPNSTVSWPQGAEIVIIQSNTGTVTIAPGAGVTLNSLDSLTDLAGRNAVVTLKRVGTDSWDLFGALA